ncbi:MAG: COX15/CtaA family protein [Xanthomonadales bacterium]
MHTTFHRLAVITAIIALCVIVLGAFVRLSDAGLGCPDWPGCYGHLSWPVEAQEVEEANRAFPERPVESEKAWKEMVHRYLAGALVILVFALNFLSWKSANRQAGFRLLTAILLVLILFQAALGMWTVTLKLWPIVVLGHLMGGLATFSMLLWLVYRSGSTAPRRALLRMRPLIITGLFVLVIQLALGGWTSANYSALACPDFPTCQGEMWPASDFREGFVLWREIGVDYEGGVLDLPSRVAIHIAHRTGALFVFIILGWLAFRLLRNTRTQLGGYVLGTLLVAQVILGILNILLYLPLPIAVAHNGVGALLLAMMIWLLHRSASGRA